MGHPPNNPIGRLLEIRLYNMFENDNAPPRLLESAQPNFLNVEGRAYCGMPAALEKVPSVRERLVVWMIEMIVQVLAFCLLVILVEARGRAFGISDIVVGCIAVLYIFIVSGYMVTTLVARLLLMRQNLLLSPAWATALFLIHFEVLNRLILPSGAAGPHDRTIIRLVGVCITCLTAVAGSIKLRQRRMPEKSIQSLF